MNTVHEQELYSFFGLFQMTLKLIPVTMEHNSGILCQTRLTSKSANEMSLIPSPFAAVLCSSVTWDPIFTRFFSPGHEGACSRSKETLSSLQMMVESSAKR